MIIGGSPSPAFSWDSVNKILTINTAALHLKFAAGCIIFVGNNQNGEVLLDTDVATNFPADPKNFCGFTSIYKNGTQVVRIPGDEVDYITFAMDGRNATLTYSPAYRPGAGYVTGSSITYYFEIDVTTGEILITAKGIELDSNEQQPMNLCIPVMNFGAIGSSVLLGMTEVLYADATLGATREVGELYAGMQTPALAVLKRNTCLGVWTEDGNMCPTGIRHSHTQSSHDMVILKSYPDPKQQFVSPYTIWTGPWRFSIQDTWLDVVKRWRAVQESRNTDLKKLWENDNASVRDIHAEYQGGYSAGMVAVTTPANVLAYGTFTNYLVQPQDNHIFFTGRFPSAANTALLLAAGFKIQGYWGDTILYTAAKRLERMTWAEGLDWVPEGYTYPNDFAPTYSGPQTPDGFDAYWEPVSIDLGSGQQCCHPASTEGIAFISNYTNLCEEGDFFGCFWDTAGSRRDGWIDPDSMNEFALEAYRIINGKDYIAGFKDWMAEVYASYPIMSEKFVVDLMPYSWFCWEGVYQWRDTTINHPLRAALIGSYQWSMDKSLTSDRVIDYDAYDFVESALIGALPRYILDTDAGAGTDSPFSRARAALFCTYEMHNDLPTTWGDSAVNLAWYKSNTGNMFRFEKRATGRYAYVEVDSPEVTRLQYEKQEDITCPNTGLAAVFTDTYGNTPTVVATIINDSEIVNGTFTGNADGWTLGSFTYGTNNVGHANGGGTTALSQVVSSFLLTDAKYRLSFTVSGYSGAGTVTPSCGGQTGSAISSNGAKTWDFVPTTTADLAFTPTDDFVGTIDSVTLVRITETVAVTDVTLLGATITCYNYDSVAVERVIDWIVFGT